jgi:hypothetical protein
MCLQPIFRNCKIFIQTCIPAKLVCLGKRDPDYISPLVKYLLNKRNKFRRQGNRTDADKLASVTSFAGKVTGLMLTNWRL